MIGAVGIGYVMAIALKIGIERNVAPISRVVVAPETVGLPNLDSRILDQFAGAIEYPSDDME